VQVVSAFPAVVGVNVTEQLPDTSVQVVELNEPTAPVSENVTVPVGVVIGPVEVSLTVAVQFEPWFATTELGEQATTVDVVCWPTRTCTTSR